MKIKSHNVLTHDDVYTIYYSMHISTETQATYQCSLTLNIALLTVMRPSELHKLNISQFTRMKQGNKRVWKISGSMGRISCTARNCKGGFKDVKINPKTFYVFDEDLMDGKINGFKDIQEYLEIRSTIKMSKDNNNRFLASLNVKATDRYPSF